MLNGKKKFKDQKNFFFTYDNLSTLDKTNPTRGPNHFLHCFFVQKWKWSLQEWTRFNEIIVQQWSIISVQDIVTFGPNDSLLSNMGACHHPVRRTSECTG